MLELGKEKSHLWNAHLILTLCCPPGDSGCQTHWYSSSRALICSVVIKQSKLRTSVFWSFENLNDVAISGDFEYQFSTSYSALQLSLSLSPFCWDTVLKSAWSANPGDRLLWKFKALSRIWKLGNLKLSNEHTYTGSCRGVGSHCLLLKLVILQYRYNTEFIFQTG